MINFKNLDSDFCCVFTLFTEEDDDYTYHGFFDTDTDGQTLYNYLYDKLSKGYMGFFFPGATSTTLPFDGITYNNSENIAVSMAGNANSIEPVTCNGHTFWGIKEGK